MKILSSKRHIYLKVIVSFMLILFSMSSFAKSYLTFDEFKSLPKKDQLSVLNKVQSVIATIEKKQSIHLRRAEAEKYFKNNKTTSYEKQILKLWSLVIAKAYAGNDFSFKGISGDELCLFGGWPSYKTFSPSLNYNVCVHPDRISDISGLSPEKKALGEAYDQFKAKYACSSSHGILCNPALYGELDYCAPGKDVITAQDSSIACWVESKKQNKDKQLLTSITSNGEFSEEFHGLLKLVFGMCLCQGKYVDTDGKRKRVITEFYSNYAMGHRTCAGLLSQVRKVTNNLKLAGTCSGLTSSSIDNVSSFINNINSKVDDYLNNEMFTGNGASQAYYENYSTLGFNRTAVEKAKNQLRKNATLEDDQYCNGTLYTDDEEEKIPPVVIVNKDDKGDTYQITITIDFRNSTYTENEFKLEVTTDPNVEAVSITNNVYVFNKIETDINVTIKYTQTNLEIHNSNVIIPGKKTASDKVDLKVTEVEDKEEHIRYQYQVIYKGEDITNKTDKYELEITGPTGADLKTLMTSLQGLEFTNQFTKIDSAYDVNFYVKHKASNTEDNELVSIKVKDDDVVGYKIAIEETKAFDDDKYYLNAYVKEGDNRLDEVPEGHKIEWYLKNSTDILQEEAAIEVLRKQDTNYLVAKLIGTDNVAVDSAEKEILGKDANVEADKYEIEIAENKTKTEDDKIELTAVVFENKDGTKEELNSIPDDHTVQWYKEGSKVDGANALTNNFERTDTTYAVEIKLLDSSENEVSKANANIDKKDSSDTDGDSISISITKNELVEETYKLEATITYKSEETTEIPQGYSVKWTISSESTDDDDDNSDDDLLDALDSDEDTTVTKTGTLSINVAQGKLTKVVKVEVLKDDESKSSDSVTLEGTGIDLEEDDDTDRSIGSNKNPYQQQMKPPMSVPRPKMILRGKDGHQGRWGY